MKDNHVHSTISHDGKSSIMDYVRIAPKLGVDEITFTEHYDDYTGLETNLSTLDVESYYKTVQAIQNETDFPINFGIEIGLQPHITESVKALVQKYPFDYIIGSSHITCKLDMAYDKAFFEGYTRREAYMRYFSEALENIRLYDEFDSYGHLDYVVRYGGYAEKSIDYDEFAEILDEILLALIKKDKGLEVNTSGLRNGIGKTHPNDTILRRYHELGGKIITLGSDAHRAEDLAGNFHEAASLLKEIGFREVAFYRNRKPDFISISEFIR